MTSQTDYQLAKTYQQWDLGKTSNQHSKDLALVRLMLQLLLPASWETICLSSLSLLEVLQELQLQQELR